MDTRLLARRGEFNALRSNLERVVLSRAPAPLVQMTKTASQVSARLAGAASLASVGTILVAAASAWVDLWRVLQTKYHRRAWQRRHNAVDMFLGEKPAPVVLRRLSGIPTPPSTDVHDGVAGWDAERWSAEYKHTVYSTGPAGYVYQTFPSQAGGRSSRRPWGLQLINSCLPWYGGSQIPHDERAAVMRSSRPYLGELSFFQEVEHWFGGDKPDAGVTFNEQQIYLYPFLPVPFIDGHYLSYEDHSPRSLAWALSLYHPESSTRGEITDDQIATFIDHYTDWCELARAFYVLDASFLPVRMVHFTDVPARWRNPLGHLSLPSIEGLTHFLEYASLLLVLLAKDGRVDIGDDPRDPLELLGTILE